MRLTLLSFAGALGLSGALLGCGEDDPLPPPAIVAPPSSTEGLEPAPACATRAAGPTRGSPIAISPDDEVVVTVNHDYSGTIAVAQLDWIDGLPSPRGEPKMFNLGGEPYQIALDACGDVAYVAFRLTGKVVAIAGLHDEPNIAGIVSVGSEPTGLALSPSNETLYVANWVDGTVSIVDTKKMALTATVDLNQVLLDTGLLQQQDAIVQARPSLAHPRSVAVTNDGDEDDHDERVLVTEWFSQRVEPHAPDGSNADTHRVGLVYTIDLARGELGVIELPALEDTGFADTANEQTGCYPNQLQSITIHDGFAYVPSICASPEGPINVVPRSTCDEPKDCAHRQTCADGRCTCAIDADCGTPKIAGACGDDGRCKHVATNVKTLTHPVVHVVDLATGHPVPSPSLNRRFEDLYVGLGLPDDRSRRYPLVTNDVVFDGRTAWITANGADAVFRLEYAHSGELANVGSAQGGPPFISLDIAYDDDSAAFVELPDGYDGSRTRELGQNPIGIVLARAHEGVAFVLDDTGRNVAVLDLVAEDLARDGSAPLAFETAPPPVNVALSRGRHFFATGLDRWSYEGQAWSACQTCHFEGLTDNVTWFFGRGPRQSTSLDGSFGDGPDDQRIFNWTAIFDEVADFEVIARSMAGGVGATVHTVGNPPVSSDRVDLAKAERKWPNSGLNGSSSGKSVISDWDDVEAWLVGGVRSPRAPSTLDPGAVGKGREIFAEACVGCHGGSKWTVSSLFYEPGLKTNALLWTTSYDGEALGIDADVLPAPPGERHMRSPMPNGAALSADDQMQCVLRSVGTYGVPSDLVVELKADMATPAQGNAEIGRGFNVPSLLGVQVGGPFFHAGNAKTLEALLGDTFPAHRGAFSDRAWSDDDVAAVVSFLLSIQDSEAGGTATEILALPAPGPGGGVLCCAPGGSCSAAVP